ncbi:GNAT family N-acetyltransferase [Fulvivirga lutimaris]|uniref:GNAT family N-acetyltransferase n=1 Tax=Fulvivirga lutimaris TaxID=1819566 RepID=UPI0012BD508E|nr:GNAT family N-acetyltransferase [Fulvivirga lutimaris]MTI40244.1 N-acetyltransferase [Fulvivirga lutimaris]
MNVQELIKIDRQLGLALEETEAVYWSKYYHADNKLPSFSSIIASAFVGAVPQLDVLAMNRVIGLGMVTIVNPEDIDSIINFYKKAGTRRFFIQLSNNTIQDNLPDLLTKAGFRLHNHWAKLMKKLDEPIAISPTELRITRITTEEANRKRDYGQILYDCFDWGDPRLKDWLSKTIGQTGYRNYLAYQDEVPIAAAALHLMGRYASLAFAGTLPSARGLGAQRALIEQRLQEAQEAGCDYIFSETGVSTIEKPVQSYKNMIKLGFQEVYQRQNWILEL